VAPLIACGLYCQMSGTTHGYRRAAAGSATLNRRSDSEETMAKPIKYAEKAVTLAAGAAWAVFDRLNAINRNASFTPKWSDKPLLKSWEKMKPTLGWPRETDSLCPRCIPEIRKRILDGELPVSILEDQKLGEIKAQIIERDG